MPKSLLITGSNAGIGRQTAHLFAEKGWQVAASMRDLSKAGDLADHPNISLFQLDVTNPTSVQQAAAACLAAFDKLDLVVNNAGFGVYGPCELATEEEIDLQYDVNVKGVIRVMKAFLPHFRKNSGGLIINISSVAGLITYPLGSLYNSSKWALEGLTEGMYYELKPFNIRLKLVEPGSFATNFQQKGLIWTASDTINDYDEMLNHIKSYRADLQTKLANPIAVAEKVYEAAIDGSERLRYIVGNDAEAMVAKRHEVGVEAFMRGMYERMLGPIP